MPLCVVTYRVTLKVLFLLSQGRRYHHQSSRYGVMYLRSVLVIVAAPVLFGALATDVTANPGFGSHASYRASASSVGQGPFAVDPKLRGRVDFWKDIFSKYGNKQVVVHHREFPQVVFGVLDFSAEAQVMGPVELERHRDRVERETIASMRQQISALIEGQEARTSFQRSFIEKMEQLPAEARSYRRVLDEDLIRTQTGIRERYGQAMMRAWRYLPAMEKVFVEDFGLPKELTRIPFIESSFDYTAYSSVGAAGIWQFMPRTARSHRLLVGRYVDERRDPLKATRAAAEYLRSAYQSLGAWPLAITSYNHGVGGVRSKVRQAGTDNIADIIEHPSERYFGFASTNFYPEFLAAMEIFEDHDRYFPEIPVQPPLRVAAYPVRTAMSSAHAARQLGISVEALKEANYALLDPVWKGRASIPAGYVLQVPVQVNERMVKLETPEPLHSRVVQVAGGSHAAFVRSAKRVESSQVAVEAGNMPSDEETDTRLPPVSVSVTDPSVGPVSRSAMKAPVLRTAAKGSTKTSSPKKSPSLKHRVRSGETLFTIAQRYKCSVADLKRVNRIKGTRVNAGQNLTIP